MGAPAARLQDTRYLSVASAGTLGNAYFGALDAFEDLIDYDSWRAHLLGVAGTSAGCICALVVALGMSRHERAELMNTFDVHKIVHEHDLALLANEFGCNDGAVLRANVQSVLMQAGLSSRSTFADFFRLVRIDFRCVATDLQGADGPESVMFSMDTTPHVTICDAIVASCAVPILFCPREVAGRAMCVDGNLTCSLPECFPLSQTFVLGIDPDWISKRKRVIPSVKSWQDFIGCILKCAPALQLERQRAIRRAHADTAVFVEFPSSVQGTSMNLQLSDSERDDIVRAGYVSVFDHACEGRLRNTVATAVRCYATLRHCPLSYTHLEDVPPSG